MKTEKRIAKAERTFLGFEDHGLLTCYVEFNYGGSVQAIPPRIFGSQDQWSKDPKSDWSESNRRFALMVMAVLRAFAVGSWEKIIGRTIYAIVEDGLIVGLEPLPTERGVACNFREMFDQDAVNA